MKLNLIKKLKICLFDFALYYFISMYSYELFANLSQVNFLPCELDSNKIIKYLNQVHKSDYTKPYVELVLKQTQRIPTNILCSNLRLMAQTYLSNPSNPRPTHVCLPEKIGSEQYFFSQVYDLFPEISIPSNIINEFSLLDNIEEINVLIVDDASFSGNNTLTKVDNLTYLNKKTKFNFIILIGCQLESIDIVIQETRLQPAQVSRMNVINIPGYFNPPYVQLDSFDYNNLKNESKIMSTCFFDHKVPNNFGSWPQIYLDGYLFDPKNKQNFGNLFVGDQIPTKQPILDVFQQLNLLA